MERVRSIAGEPVNRTVPARELWRAKPHAEPKVLSYFISSLIGYVGIKEGAYDGAPGIKDTQAKVVENGWIRC